MTASTAVRPRLSSAGIVITAAWFALAVFAGVTGVLLQLSFPLPQLVILTLIAAALVAVSTPVVRAWIDTVPLSWLVGVNTLRFVGASFLLVASQGNLAHAFADRAGWGDIAVATIALALVALGHVGAPSKRLVVHAWNALGALDLVVAVTSATWVTFTRATPGVAPLLSFPFSAIPLFFVPAFLAIHLAIFRRLRAASRGSDVR